MIIYDGNGKAVLDTESIAADTGKVSSAKRRSEWGVNELPTLYINGDMTGMSHDTECKMTYRFESSVEQFCGYLKMKWQGNSSLSWAKHNFTIKLYDDAKYKRKDTIDFGWGEHNKYVLKSNLNDATMARNVCSARIWGDIVKSRKTALREELLTAPNYGAINGFPCILYLNGEYWGLYDLNIPKDDWMLGLDEDNEKHCAVCGASNNNGNGGTPLSGNSVLSSEFRLASTAGWEIEVPDAYNTMTTSGLTTLISFVINSTDAEFKENLNTFLDVESAIDYYIYAYFMLGSDSLARNVILMTWNCRKWYCSMYDMDNTWKNSYNPNFNEATTPCPEGYQDTNSLLWQRLEAVFPQELYDRYTELRNTVLSVDYVQSVFRNFGNQISAEQYQADATKWNRSTTGDAAMLTLLQFVSDRASYCDSQFAEFNQNA